MIGWLTARRNDYSAIDFFVPHPTGAEIVVKARLPVKFLPGSSGSRRSGEEDDRGRLHRHGRPSLELAIPPSLPAGHGRGLSPCIHPRISRSRSTPCQAEIQIDSFLEEYWKIPKKFSEGEGGQAA